MFSPDAVCVVDVKNTCSVSFYYYYYYYIKFACLLLPEFCLQVVSFHPLLLEPVPLLPELTAQIVQLLFINLNKFKKKLEKNISKMSSEGHNLAQAVGYVQQNTS